jgi:OmpA-OmpF porin, OOP family
MQSAMKLSLCARRWWVGAAFTLAVVSASGVAHGQTLTSAPSVALDRFSPAEAGSGWFALDALDLRGDWRWTASVVTDEAYRPLVLRAADGSVAGNVVTNQLATYVQGSVVVRDRWRFALSLPIFLVESGATVAVSGYGYPTPASGIGDPRLGADVRLFGDERGRVVGAAGLQADVPLFIGSSSYGREGTLRLRPHFSIAGRQSIWSYASRIGILAHLPRELESELPLGTSVEVAAAAGAYLWRDQILIGPEIYGSTMIDGDGPFVARSSPLEALLGAHYLNADGFGAGLGLGAGLVQATGTPPWRLLASFNYTPGSNVQ